MQDTIDASGGGNDGGDVTLIAGDDVTITKNIDVSSHGGGGFGGEVDLEAGLDEIGGTHSGGSFTLTSATLDVSGSDSDGVGGDGGDIEVRAQGLLRVLGTTAKLRAPAGTLYDGYGGGGGVGGEVGISAGRNLTLSASVNVNGKDAAGDVLGDAGGTVQLSGVINAGATSSAGTGGSVEFAAGLAQDASLTVAQNVLAAGGASNGGSQSITLTGCGLTVTGGVKVDGHAGSTPGGSTIALVSRKPMQLQTNSQFLAYPNGRITTIHPLGQNPMIGTGVTFNPPRTDSVVDVGLYPPCPTPTPTSTP